MAPQPSGNNGRSVLCKSPEDLQKRKDLGVYHQRVDSVTGFVLAGGKSSRMGQDKAFLELGGRTLLAHALEQVRAVTGNTWIVGSAAKFACFGPVVEDVFPACGPLGGIQAALTAAVTDLNLITAVDMPFIQVDFLNYLIAQARSSNAMVVVPRAGGKLQPLCAIYRRNFVEVAERSLRAGKNKVGSLFAEIQTLVIEEPELQRSGFNEEMFRNLNTEQEWQQAKQKLSAGDQKHL
jgi:molybdopterin-guanine dinucleotide biosynthesis protein A